MENHTTQLQSVTCHMGSHSVSCNDRPNSRLAYTLQATSRRDDRSDSRGDYRLLEAPR